MTKRQILLCYQLLSGFYVAAITKHGKKSYRLFDDKHNSIGYVANEVVDKLDKYMSVKPSVNKDGETKRLSLWKKDKWNRKTLNLAFVRKLHGRSTLKKMYKARNHEAELKQFLRPVNNRKKQTTKTKTDQDEKILTLF